MTIRRGEVAACHKQKPENQKDENYNERNVGRDDRNQESENENGPYCAHFISDCLPSEVYRTLHIIKKPTALLYC